MYEGLSFVIEGAETGDLVAGVFSEYFGEAFDDAHEDILARNGG